MKLQTSSYWTVARPGGRGVPLSPAASCAEAFCGHFGAPREVTSENEQYVTFLSHLFIQLARGFGFGARSDRLTPVTKYITKLA